MVRNFLKSLKSLLNPDIFSYSKPLRLKAAFFFYKKYVSIGLSHDDDIEFDVESLEVVYDFDNKKLSKEQLKCITTSMVYCFSVKQIDRHVLHQQFTCEIVYKLKKCSGRVKATIQFDVPYFQTITEMKIERLTTRPIPNELQTLFICNFLEHPLMNPEERKLLEMIK